MEVSPVEIRVLGALVEKARTTPDAYPLTLNTLRLACNQSTNRDPVTDLDDAAIRAALERLSGRRWARLASGAGSRAPKYRHLLSDTLGLGDDELSLLALLMLRGPQTPGELKARGERLHPFADLSAVEATLERLIERGHARRLERRPGQKEERYEQTLGRRAGGGEVTGAGAGPAPEGDPTQAPSREPCSDRRVATGSAGESLEDRVARLEEEVSSLRATVERLRAPGDAA